MSILQHRVKPAEYVRNIYAATPSLGTKYEDTLEPSYWAHTAAQFAPGSRIEVTAEDGAWFAELYVVSVGRAWAKVCPMRYVELSQSAADEPASAFKVIWRGAVHKHSVVRTSDKEVIKSEFGTAEEARKWLHQYEAEVAK